MIKWIKKLLTVHKLIESEDLFYDLYHYTIKPQIVSLLELRSNTWDTARVDKIINTLSYINLEEFSKDIELKEYIARVRKGE